MAPRVSCSSVDRVRQVGSLAESMGKASVSEEEMSWLRKSANMSLTS